MVGIVYTDAEEAYEKWEEIKETLEKQWVKEKKATSQFIDDFFEKYHICYPNDLFFDMDGLFDL